MAAGGNSAIPGSADQGSLGGSCGGGDLCVAAVHTFYGAINNGDGEALSALLAPDVEWDCFELPTSAQKVGVPWLQAARGRAAVLSAYRKLATQLDGAALASGFHIKQIAAQGNTVFTTSETVVACKATGKLARMEGAYMFQFNEEGLIKAFKHFVDTGAHIWVATADDDSPAAWAAMGRNESGAAVAKTAETEVDGSS